MKKRLLPHVKVWARTSPQQKEEILSGLKGLGYTTFMCGDGTNDVGALKQAHIGVALLTSAPKRSFRKDPAKKKNKKKQQEKKKSQKPEKRGRFGVRMKQPGSLMDLVEGEDSTMVQLGDASIAAPFTSRSDSVLPILNVVRQGRCTLVATMQIFKILALNCLIHAYSLSVLYYDGVRLGERQAVFEAFLVPVCFLFISISKPLDKLSKERPISRWYSPQIVISVLGQFAFHLASLMYLTALAKEAYLSSGAEITMDEKFAPNILNTVVFMIALSMRISTFLTNYQGRPFMQGLTENRPLLYVLLLAVGFIFIFVTESIPPLNEYLELVPLGDLQLRVILVVVADGAASFLWDRFIKLIL
eukprot:TRINITY_DN2617_c0_g1_i7.p1 TRINITY_DN2617_c0_g1~~TRINITY_DN2617_c0_g1_i7.p1  ORF type:complete len:360 (-),score=57.58 TRINITY_DN2617_c0_g1_i7:61-1140(-)